MLNYGFMCTYMHSNINVFFMYIYFFYYSYCLIVTGILLLINIIIYIILSIITLYYIHTSINKNKYFIDEIVFFQTLLSNCH